MNSEKKCKHENEVVCIDCNADMTIKEMLDDARAEEREDVLYDVKSELLVWADQITESQDTVNIKDFAGYLMVKLGKGKKASESLGEKPLSVASVVKPCDSPSRNRVYGKSPKPEKPKKVRP